MKHTQVSTAELTKQKKGYEIKDQLDEIKWEGKIREKRVKRNEDMNKASKKYGIM